MGHPFATGNAIFATLHLANKTWYYPRIMESLADGGATDEPKATRTRRLPALAAGETGTEGGRPVGRTATANARPAPRGSGRTRRHRRRLVHQARAGPHRQPVGGDHRRAGARAAARQDR